MFGKRIIVLVLAAIIGSTGLNAQKILKKANKQFELNAFEMAIPNYLAYLEDNPDDIEVQVKLAEAYRLSHNYLQSLKWYEKVTTSQENIPAEAMLNYAHTLKRVGLYDKAQKWYWNYKEVDPIVGEHFAISCDFAKYVLQEDEKYQLALCKYNTPASEFGVSFFNDKMVFSSFGSDGVMKSNNQLVSSDDNFSKLYIESEDGSEAIMLKSNEGINTGLGPVSYSKNGKLVAFTNNDFKDGQTQTYHDDNLMGIYFGISDESGDFTEVRPFTHNGADYSNTFPHLAYNGNALYFASNKDGGYGGYDIYVSYFKEGIWSYPENLGQGVNTSGNEITPFFDGNELYYSSDYIQGLGGYDVFKSKVVSGEWTFGENMGNGINSPADDYYFIKNIASGEMFFTSNRLGGRGNDDIYIATEKPAMDYAYEVPAEENVFVPKAVSLADLKPIKRADLEMDYAQTQNTQIPDESIREHANVMEVGETTTIEIIETEEDNNLTTTEAPEYIDNVSLSLMGARKTALGEVVNTGQDVYFVQLAALSRSKINLEMFRGLVSYGNIYKVYKTNSTKIRLGYYLDREEAKEVLADVKRKGYFDAFITKEALNASDLELVASANEIQDYKDDSFDYVGQSKYKVRLAAYSDPLWFDTQSIAGMGKLEQWTKGNWTIFVLSGFRSLEEAQNARIKSQQKGFKDAEVVIDNGGILERLTSN